MLAAALLLPSLLAPGAAPPADAVKLSEPRVHDRNNEASATRSPWIDANGWRILRSPGKTFVYQVKGEAAALAAAEAFTYGSGASISTDAAGENAFRQDARVFEDRSFGRINSGGRFRRCRRWIGRGGRVAESADADEPAL